MTDLTSNESFMARIGQQSEVTGDDRTRLIKLAGFADEYSYLIPMELTESQFLFLTALDRVAAQVARKLTS